MNEEPTETVLLLLATDPAPKATEFASLEKAPLPSESVFTPAARELKPSAVEPSPEEAAPCPTGVE